MTSPGFENNDSEATPLLEESNSISKHEELYRRFKPSQKRVILAIVSVTGLLPLFISGTFIPSVPQISKELDSSPTIISLAVSISIFASSWGSLLGATYSAFYGRKPVYLVGTPLLVLGSFGVAAAPNVPQLLVWRFVQAIGASPGLAVGSGVIGDIYKLEERGRAMGIFFATILLGPAIAPLAGGFAAHYFSWRLMQFWMGLTGLLIFFIALFILPETYHPGQRGVDKVTPGEIPSWRPVILNPFKPLLMLRSPNLLAVTMAGFLTLLTDYVLLVPIASTIGKRYGITNEALIGACFLPCGIGNMVGAPLAGSLSDKCVTYYRKKHGGVWYPEDRLRATIPGALILIPLSVLGSGLVTRFIAGRLGLTLNLVCLFCNGVGVDFVLSPAAAYMVDLMHSQSAEAMAASNAFRSIIMASAIAGILPMVESYGGLVTNTVSAILAWIGFGLLYGTIRYGDRLRAFVNVGFSTADNN